MQNAEVARILKLLDSLMASRKVRRSDLARRLGIAPGNLWRVFNGDLELRYRLVIDILAVLEIPPLAFFQIVYEDKKASTDLLAARLNGLAALEQPRVEPVSKAELRQLVMETLEQLGVLELLDQGADAPTPEDPPAVEEVDPSTPATTGPSPKKPSRRRRPPTKDDDDKK
jgi:transcriptional regulator with XRE-family HTH domain